VHNDQANRLARLGQYTDALAEWDRAVEVKPRDDAGWYYRGCLLAYLGDGDRYRENCREMAKRFANDRSFYVVEVTLKTCALRPDCDVPQERLRDMARQMDDPPDSGMNSWANLAKGMARYRLKEFDRCLAAMEESQKDGAREGRDAIASLFMAMADERLGHHQRARQTFAEVDEFVKAEPHPRLGNPDLTDDEQMSVEDWLILKVVHKEAAELLKGVSPGSTRP
jgi:tetratricopeptide (TPR) repeat protein